LLAPRENRRRRTGASDCVGREATEHSRDCSNVCDVNCTIGRLVEFNRSFFGSTHSSWLSARRRLSLRVQSSSTALHNLSCCSPLSTVDRHHRAHLGCSRARTASCSVCSFRCSTSCGWRHAARGLLWPQREAPRAASPPPPPDL
jgi:hypothetical protein